MLCRYTLRGILPGSKAWARRVPFLRAIFVISRYISFGRILTDIRVDLIFTVTGLKDTETYINLGSVKCDTEIKRDSGKEYSYKLFVNTPSYL